MRARLSLVLLFLFSSAANAATFNVTTTADSGAGSLRDAITSANATAEANTIAISATGTIQLASALPALAGSVTIAGPGAALLTVSGNGASSFRVFTIAAGATADISGLTITNGAGGIQNNGTLTLRHAVVTANSVAGLGAGIQNSGTATIEDSQITNNQATSFRGNGGGIRQNAGATLTIERSTISGNHADSGGGGISGGVGMTIDATTIANNSANQGGGINMQADESRNVVITNSTISGNNGAFSGTYAGGGITHIVTFNRTVNTTLQITNSTIAGNSAFSGGGIYSENFSYPQSFTHVQMTNTIVATNQNAPGGQAPDVFLDKALLQAMGNLIGDGTGAQVSLGTAGMVGTSSSPIDPLLGPLANNGGPTQTRALLSGSPAIDAGTAAGATTVDQRGFARDAKPDIGAFEVVPNTPPSITAVPVTIQRGSSASVQIATVSDVETPANQLGVTATAQSGSGIALSSISTDASGHVSATATAACDASDSTFTLNVTDALGASATATLTVSTTAPAAPSFTQQPSDQQGCLGHGVTFTASATNATSYQWMKSGTAISGATAPSYTIGSVTAGDAAVYSVIASNACTSAESNAAQLTVTDVPSFAEPLASQAVCVGATVSFTGNAQNAASYQWQKNGVAIPGANSATFTIAPALRGDAADYSVVASNGCGSITSNVAQLSVTGPQIDPIPALNEDADAHCSAPVPQVALAGTCLDSIASVQQIPAAGTLVGAGTTNIRVLATDIEGVVTTATATLVVHDVTPPEVTASVSPRSLWPPNHQMVPITVNAVAVDACGSATCRITGVTSNEPVDGLGDGDLAPDWQITGPLALTLRAERSGTGSGRIYTITLECTDGTNPVTRQLTVTVPKSQN